jgi:uncharacterized DUF497 family protein
MSLRFEWNDKKARLNKRKHKLAFEEASTVFGDPLSLTIPDTVHSVGEDRFITIGTSDKNRLIVVVYTDNEDVIRIISARQASANEKKQYENG